MTDVDNHVTSRYSRGMATENQIDPDDVVGLVELLQELVEHGAYVDPDAGGVSCFYCDQMETVGPNRRPVNHQPDCLFQNAVDALRRIGVKL